MPMCSNIMSDSLKLSGDSTLEAQTQTTEGEAAVESGRTLFPLSMNHTSN